MTSDTKDELLAVRLHRELKFAPESKSDSAAHLVRGVAESDAAQLVALSKALFAHRRVEVVANSDSGEELDSAVFCVESTPEERLRLIAELDALTSKCAFFEKRKIDCWKSINNQLIIDCLLILVE